MKKQTRILACLLVIVLTATLFTGCQSKKALLEAKTQELCAGKWLTITEDVEEQAVILLENIDMYEEEIAVVDTKSLQYARIIEYSVNGTYRQYISVEHTKACVRNFYKSAFDALYANRADLDDLYDADLAEMTEEEFQLYYTDLYGYDDFSVMIDYFADIAYDYAWEDLESGTFTVTEENTISILRDEDTEDTSGNVTFKIENDTLTLIYSDTTVIYTNIG